MIRMMNDIAAINDEIFVDVVSLFLIGLRKNNTDAIILKIKIVMTKLLMVLR
jgi:hypothetical protein